MKFLVCSTRVWVIFLQSQSGNIVILIIRLWRFSTIASTTALKTSVASPFKVESVHFFQWPSCVSFRDFLMFRMTAARYNFYITCLLHCVLRGLWRKSETLQFFLLLSISSSSFFFLEIWTHLRWKLFFRSTACFAVSSKFIKLLPNFPLKRYIAL